MTMIKLSLLFSFLVLSNPSLDDKRGIELLHQATHCLATDKNDLLQRKQLPIESFSVTYVLDRTTAPAANHIYVVVYRNLAKSSGSIFDMVYSSKSKAMVMNLQNNASFVDSKRGYVFNEPPLGGTWTQAQLLSAIKKAESTTTTNLNLNEAEGDFPRLTCTSYAEQK